MSVGLMRLVAPENWVRKQPRSRILLAEFSLPRAEGDEADGRLTVSSVGGSVEQNVARWRQQFGGNPQTESKEEIEVAGVRVALVDFTGTYSDSQGSFAPAAPHGRYRMRAAIFDLPSRQLIVKCYGPEQTMAEQSDAFLAFVHSLKSTQGGPSEPESSPQDSGESGAEPPESTESESTAADSAGPAH